MPEESPIDLTKLSKETVIAHIQDLEKQIKTLKEQLDVANGALGMHHETYRL
jgi:hypothetical protein